MRTLNLVRNTWDSDGAYSLYSFVRQPQTFPDILLRQASSGVALLGIELKGWYLLAKEAEPSLRFQVTADACIRQDLIVVVPWALGNVISGSPTLFEPFVESARYAATYRNYHWQHVRRTRQPTGIETPPQVTPYPTKSEQILDRPRADGGSNFGRLARTGIMDAYLRKLDDVQLCGIKTVYWREFLKTFQENTSDTQIRAALDRLRQRVRKEMDVSSPKSRSTLAIIGELESLLDLGEFEE